MSGKSITRTEFGDYQTPEELAERALEIMSQLGEAPATILEPTCGIGGFVLAALAQYPKVSRIVGAEINPEYFAILSQRIAELERADVVEVRRADFFQTDWNAVIGELAEPFHIIGNPPWVTASELGVLDSSNLPAKSNLHNEKGMDAITGKSNFDIAEWMLIRLIEAAAGKHGMLGMLIKQSVARKVLLWAWKNDVAISNSALYLFPAADYFDASVDACLFVLHFGKGIRAKQCGVFDLAAPKVAKSGFGLWDGMLVSDVETVQASESMLIMKSERTSRLRIKWRSGVKHDCSKVMELHEEGDEVRNGFGDEVAVESSRLYPFLKGADVARGNYRSGKRWLILTQHLVGQDTSGIEAECPLLWNYLSKHEEKFARRKSSIYRNRPPFSIFGVGKYTFAPWKVAICGLYKKLEFRKFGPVGGKPVVFDDTVYFYPCENEDQADALMELLASKKVRRLLNALVFWDAKRPITSEVLNRLDLAELLGVDAAFETRNDLFASA